MNTDISWKIWSCFVIQVKDEFQVNYFNATYLRQSIYIHTSYMTTHTLFLYHENFISKRKKLSLI